LLQGTLSREATARRLARYGFDATKPLQLLVIRAADVPLPGGELSRTLADASIAHLMLEQRDHSYLLGEAGGGLRDALSVFDDLRVGASRAFDSGQRLGAPRREALWAAARAVDAGLGFVGYGDDSIGRWLIEDAPTLRALVSTVLGAAQAYDREHDIELVRTVQTWLERDRHNAATAQALHLHPNTLAYRLRRFSEVSGRDLHSTADLAELWLALRALGHLGVDADLALAGLPTVATPR
jgi:purine catabolism regulator